MFWKYLIGCAKILVALIKFSCFMVCFTYVHTDSVHTACKAPCRYTFENSNI